MSSKTTKKVNSPGNILNKNKPLTKKQAAFVKHLVEHPKDSATKAALATYGTTDKPPTYLSAGQIAFDNLNKPNIVSELAKYNNLVENSIINTINRYQDSDKLPEVSEAMTNARWVHDKIHGKATQKLETQSTSVNIAINLNSEED